MDCGHMIRAFTTEMQDSYLNIPDLSGLYNSVMDSMANDQVKLPPRYRKGGYQAVIDAFDARRWAFVPASLQLKMDKSICYEKCILPFFHMDIINRGGTATVYHCKVQVDLVKDELANILESSKKKDPAYGDYYELAIKSYMSEYADVYKMESTAFTGMQGQEGLGVVKYLGAYHTDGGNHRDHIMLEYGEQDLDEYLADTSPPVLNKEIIDFWESLFKVAHTLEGIHILNHKGEDGNMHLFNGWHGDIKPENILHVRQEFKLADFGFSKFKLADFDFSKLEKHIASTRLLGGTRTYGAPERDTVGRSSQTTDTWSFGCVLSAVATWVILGPSFCLGYDMVRQDAIKDLRRRRQHEPNISVPDCDDAFHDGSKVLDAVTEWHDHLRNSTRRADTISRHVLDLVDQGMLVDDPEKRLTSAKLCDSLDNIILRANREYQQSVDNGTLKKESEGTLKALLKLDLHAPTIAKSFSQAEKESDSATNPKPPHEQNSTLPHPRLSNRVRKSEYFGKIVFGKTANREQVIRSDSKISDLNETSEQGSRSEIIPIRKLPNPILQTTHHELDATHSRVIGNGIEMSGGYLSIDPNATRKELNDPYDPAIPSPISAVSEQDFGEDSILPNLRLQSGIPAVAMEYHRLMELWAKSKGVSSLFTKIPKDDYLDNHISKRDITFVVDNSHSMKLHWTNSEMTLLTLAMKIGPLDKDGLDLRYTIGEHHDLNHIKSWKIESRFRQSMRDTYARIDERDQTDMAATLSAIFDDYMKDFSKKHTLIILTNGLWEGSGLTEDVENVILTFIADLKTKIGLLKRRWFTIQFISFGNDERALLRLQDLDDNLNAKDDIVDTKPWDFPDVNPLILGSITQNGDDAKALPMVSTPSMQTTPPLSARKRKNRLSEFLKS
ncbi:kinase-like domain-containing protein [Ilyonectria destructans]|nr:kinase-like domain-containing protein [Ilyonectria destructans]